MRLILTVAIAAFVVSVFGTSFQSMWALWQTTDHRHGLVVFPIALFLIWQLREELAEGRLSSDLRGLTLVVVLAAMWLVARLAGVQALEHLAALAMIPAVAVTLLGADVAGKMAFPLFFVVMATPIGDAIVPHLMIVTADLSAFLLTVSGVPFFRDGQYMSLPGGDFVVADVCSGLRYLLAGSMIALLFGYKMYDSSQKRLIFLAVTAVTLVITNGVRAYVVMAVASATDMRYFAGRDHVYFGWIMFGVVIMLLMWIGAKYADDLPAAQEEPESQAPALRARPIILALGVLMLALTIMPLVADFGEFGAALAAVGAMLVLTVALIGSQRMTGSRSANESAAAMRRDKLSLVYGAVAFAALSIVVATPRFAAMVERNALGPADAVADLESLQNCRPLGPWSQSWRPHFENPFAESSAQLKCVSGAVDVFIASYAGAQQGSELINSANYPVPTDWVTMNDYTERQVQLGDGRDLGVAEVRVRRPHGGALVWYWYDVAGKTSTATLETKKNQLLMMILGRPSGGSVVVVSTAVNSADDGNEARKRLSVAVTDIAADGGSMRPRAE
ncbi:MAG: exosortase A [Pseudomonadota bacterium]